MESFKLLLDRRFGPFFWTQAFGAFNDNLFKNALVILITYTLASQEQANLLVQISAGLFILPFAVFSAVAGQICDKSEKAHLIRVIKFVEIIIMTAAAVAFIFHATYLLMLILFLMGTQSSIFGPVKYSYLPNALRQDEVVGGNALISMSTFISILLGTMCGGLLVSKAVLEFGDTWLVSGVVIVFAIFGWMASRKIPKLSAVAPDIKLKYNILTQTVKTMYIGYKDKTIFCAILSISWFWFYGFFFLATLPGYCKAALSGNEVVATFLLTMFSLGIGFGSILCGGMSRGKIKLWMITLGSIGLTIFAGDLYFSGMTNEALLPGTLIGLKTFLANPINWRISLDLVMIGAFGGFYIVPLTALIQLRAKPKVRSRMIASLNIYNAIFMVAAAAFNILLANVLKLTVLEIFLVVALLNMVAGIIYVTINKVRGVSSQNIIEPIEEKNSQI